MSKLNRREFIKIIKNVGAVLGITAIVAPIVGYFYPTELEEMPSEPIPAGPVTDLPVGMSTTVRFGRYPAIIIHTEDGLRAYSAVCTHFACITYWDENLGQIVCPCHDGYFDPLDGHVISGPPPTPLEKLSVEVKDGIIYVGGQA